MRKERTDLKKIVLFTILFGYRLTKSERLNFCPFILSHRAHGDNRKVYIGINFEIAINPNLPPRVCAPDIQAEYTERV